MDQHDPAAVRVRGRAGTSPRQVELPLWLDACVLLSPPRTTHGTVRTARFAVYPVARALMADRIRARGDESVELDRHALARWAGFHHARNCGWILKYLQRIGFLEIHSHPCASGQRPDTFDVFETPPENYVGPTTYAELDSALRRAAAGEPVAVFASGPTTKRAAARSAPSSAPAESAQVNPSSAPAELGLAPSSAPAESAQVNPSSAPAELGSAPSSAPAESAQVNPSSAPAELAIYRGTSGTSVEEVPEVVGEGATPPADAGADAAAPQEDDWALHLALALPWSTRLQHRRPSWAEVHQLAARFRVAHQQYRRPQHEVQERALLALEAARPTGADPKANPVSYVTGAFSERRLTEDAAVTETLTLPTHRTETPEEQEQRGDPAEPTPTQPAGEQHQPEQETPFTSPVEWLSGEEFAQLSPWSREIVRKAAELGEDQLKSIEVRRFEQVCLDHGRSVADPNAVQDRALLRARRERDARTAEPTQ